MTRILLVKLSSLGDVIHNLPVVTDIHRHYPDAEIDWVTETPYTPLLKLHPAVNRALPLSLRNLKKNGFSPVAWGELWEQRKVIKQSGYELIIDTQGLLKSAMVTRWNAAPSAGFGPLTARESSAARCYGRTVEIAREQHAVKRNRDLVAAALGYTADGDVDYGLLIPPVQVAWLPAKPYVVFLHATSRENKKWPTTHWRDLAQRFIERGIMPVLPWGNESEVHTSKMIAEKLSGAFVPPAMSLTDAATLLGNAQCVIGVDTGLAHLAVALKRPTVGLYITTSPQRTGLYGGANAVNLGGGDSTSPSVPGVDAVWQIAAPWVTR